MKGREFETYDLESRDSEKSLARRFFPRIFLGIVVTIGLVMILLIISNQAQAGAYGVVIQHNTPVNGIGNVTPGVDFQFTVDVINNGTANPGEDINFTVELDAESLAAGWTVTPSGTTIIPNLQMGPGNKVTEIVTIRAPIDAQYGNSAVINITVDVIGHKGEVGCLDSLQLRANVARIHEVQITTAADVKTGDPNEDISFDIKVTNHGNVNDTFAFTATGLELGEWNVADVTLEPLEFIYVYYNITIDSDHNTSDILITLNGTSIGDTTGLAYDTLDITIHVNPRYKVKLGQTGGDIKDGLPGETVQFNLTVKNEGTAIDTYELDYVAPSGFVVTFSNITIEVESVVVDPPNSIKVVYVWVQIREDPPVIVNQYVINITATSLSDSSVNDTYQFIVDVNQKVEPHIIIPSSSSTVNAGDTIHIIGIAQNNGNLDDSFFVIIGDLPPGWSYIVSMGNILSPGETETVEIWIYTTNGTPPGVYQLNITIISDSDPSEDMSLFFYAEINQIFGVELPSSLISKDVNVGETASYLISVKNTGNGEDYIELRLTGSDAQFGNLYFSPTENGQTIHLTIPGGASETVYFNVTPPADYWDTGDSEIQITIEAESLDDPNVTPASDSIPIITYVNHLYNFGASGSGSSSGIPGETRVFSLTISNDGTTTDSFNLRISEISTSTGGTISHWEDANPSPFSTNPVSISLGGQQTVDVYIDIPYPADLFEVPPGNYFIEVEIASSGDPSIIKTVTFTIIVKQIYAAEIVNTITSQSVDVGSYVTYTLQVKNSGNDADNISIEVEDDDTITGNQLPWTSVTYNTQVITSIYLDAGDVAWIEFKVSVPNRTDPGYPGTDPSSVTFYVTVSPSKPTEPGAMKEKIDIATNINPIYEFEVNPISKQSGEPGDTIEFSIRIKNSGTGTDTYYPELIWGGVNWEVYQSGPQFSPASLTLGPGQTGIITLFFTIPSDNDVALVGEYTHNVTITSDLNGEDTRSFIVEVDDVYGLELTDPASLSTSVDAGSSVSYQFKIKNTGNTQDTFALYKQDLDVSPAGGGSQESWAYFALASNPSIPITSVILDADESVTILFVIDVPSPSDPDFAELTNPLDMEVEVVSEGGTNIDDYFITQTTINPVYSFELSTTAPGNTKKGEPGDSIYFTLQVRNTGTGTDSYNLRVTSVEESIFTVFDPNSISNLAVDSYATTTATIDITADKSKALVGFYDIEITATSSADSSVSEIITLTVEITPLAGIQLDPTSQTDTGEPGETVDYPIRVNNMGNAQDTFDLSLGGTNKDWGQILDSNENPISQVTLSATGTPGYFTDIILRVTIPDAGETTADQTYPITITVSSSNTDGVTDSAQVATRVEDFVDLEIEYSAGGTPDKTYDPNKMSPKFSFRATNLGNQDESEIDIRVDDIDADWDFTPKTLPDTLEPGKSTTFSLEFMIPSDTPEGDYEMQVVIESSLDPSKESDPVTITVSVVKPDLMISSGDISGLEDIDFLRDNVGNQITILITVHNVGTSAAENVQVKLYEDSSIKRTTTISSIEPNGIRNVTFRWKVVAEELELKVEATPIEESNDNNNEVSIYLDLRPDLSFYGDIINFSKSNPKVNETITIKTYVRNTGADAEDVNMKFLWNGKVIGVQSFDIGYNDVQEISIEWVVPDRPNETLIIRAEIDHSDSIGDGEKATRSIQVEEEEIDNGDGLPVSPKKEEDDILNNLLWILICIIAAICALFIGYLLGGRGRAEQYPQEEEYPQSMYPEQQYSQWSPEQPQMPPPPPPPPPPPE